MWLMFGAGLVIGGVLGMCGMCLMISLPDEQECPQCGGFPLGVEGGRAGIEAEREEVRDVPEK